MKKDIIIIPEHFLPELLKIDEGKNIGLQKRILIIITDYINRKKTKENTKEND